MIVVHMQSEFEKWLLETFGEEFDENNVDHLLKQGFFLAGWDARNNLEEE